MLNWISIVSHLGLQAFPRNLHLREAADRYKTGVLCLQSTTSQSSLNTFEVRRPYTQNLAIPHHIVICRLILLAATISGHLSWQGVSRATYSRSVAHSFEYRHRKMILLGQGIHSVVPSQRSRRELNWYKPVSKIGGNLSEFQSSLLRFNKTRQVHSKFSSSLVEWWVPIAISMEVTRLDL